MPLCIPEIEGPLSELSQQVAVHGAIDGATVTIATDGPLPRVLGEAVSRSGSARINLGAGPFAGLRRHLNAGDRLVVWQSLNGESSEKTPPSMATEVMEVPRAPGGLGFLALKSHAYVCGKFLWVIGAFPGAEVIVEFDGAVQGRKAATPSGARLKLAQSLPDGPVTIYQKTDFGVGPKLTVYPDRIAEPGDFLPHPIITDDLFECQTSVPVGDVFDGATVTATGKLSGNPFDLSVGFDLDGLWLRLPKPLVAGDELALSQKMADQCEYRPTESNPYNAIRSALRAPRIAAASFCSGTRSIPVEDLVPGAVVEVTANGTKYLGMAPPNGSAMQFTVAPLMPGQVTVTQTLCGRSASSQPVSVLPRAVEIPLPILDGPVAACATSARVYAYDGANVVILRKSQVSGLVSPISAIGRVGAFGAVPFTVFPQPGDLLWVRQWACGDVPTDSSPEVVVTVEPLQLSGISTVRASDSEIVIDLKPFGAVADAYVETVRGPRYFGSGSHIIPVRVPGIELAQGEIVRVYARLCGERVSIETVVRRPPPATPVFRNVFERNVTPNSLTVVLECTDPWQGTALQADGYSLVVKERSTGNEAFSNRFLTTPRAEFFSLRFSTTYDWTMEAVADEIASTPLTGSLMTRAAPPPVDPPPPPPTPPVISVTESGTLKEAKLHVTGSGFLPNRPDSLQGVSIKVSVVETGESRRFFTSSSSDGKINKTIEGDLSALGGIASSTVTLSIMATDGRPNPNSLDRFLWSNTWSITGFRRNA